MIERKNDRKKLVFRLLMAIMIGAGIVFSALGDRMNRDQMFGYLVFWAFLVIWASFMFWAGTWPLFARLANEPKTRVTFGIGATALAFAICQMPMWSLMTHRFPPDKFTGTQAVIATVGVVISLFAPAAPVVIGVSKQLWAANLVQRRKFKQKTTGGQSPAAPYSER